MFRVALASLLTCLIVTTAPVPAAASGPACPPTGNGIVGFKPTIPPKPVPDEPFIVDGDKLATLEQYRGKGIVLNFWATWCGPCVREMPALSRLQDHLAKDGGKVVVLTLSQDRGGAPVVRKFFNHKKIANLPVLIDKRSRLGRRMKVRGLPMTILIDAEGQERGRVAGAAHWDSKPAQKLIQACIMPSPG